ncbi:hypothetical protein K492DRAFT_207969 [Lichtheimia hyalospora FSU 10163]|nr:hypothetical protein K492DRAFT_207969 [Lichtheimia hyalospora FSU 10163]
MTLGSDGLTSSACLVNNKTKVVVDHTFYHHHHLNRRVTLISSPKPHQLEENRNKSSQKAKKQVRFCNDTQLEHVRFFLKTQEPIAIRDGDAPCLYTLVELKYSNWPNNMPLESRQRGMICLESVEQILTKPSMTLMGQCRVANIAFQKLITVRYTTNDWQSYHETEAFYREPISGCANPMDRFIFYIDLEAKMRYTITTTVSFALCYTVNGREYWDNNDGLNYQINVVAKEWDDHDDRVIDKDMLSTYTNNTPMQVSHGSPSSNKLGEDYLQDSTTGLITKRTTKQRLAHRYNFGASLSAAKKAVSMHKRYQQTSSIALHHSLHGQQHHELKYRDIITKYCFYDRSSSATTTLSSSSTCPKPVCG